MEHDIEQDSRLMEPRQVLLYDNEVTGTAHGEKFRQSLDDTKEDAFPYIHRQPLSLLKRDTDNRGTMAFGYDTYDGYARFLY